MTRGAACIVIAHLARLALGVIFLLAALLKVADTGLFVEQIQGYDITPASWAPFLARFFLAIELGLACALIAGYRPRFTLPATVALLVVFMSAIGWAWAHGYTGECGCFGSHGVASGPLGALIEDSLFLVLAAIAWVGLRRREGSGAARWQLGAAWTGLLLGLLLPPVAARLPIDGMVTAAHAGARFDHIIVEGFEGDIQHGDYLFALLDPKQPGSAAAVEPLNALSDIDDVPQVVGVARGSNDDLVEFILEHDAYFEMGHAPPAALRRFYRKLPVYLLVRDGVIQSVWVGTAPTAGDVRGASAS